MQSLKKSLIILLTNILFVVSVMGQTKTTFTGYIKTLSGEGVADVNVYISYKNQRYRVFASCLSEQNGSFSLSFKAPVDSVCINVTGLNIISTSLICVNKTHYRDIIVEKKAQELTGVVVRAPKIYSHGDTINYYVSSFQSKNDISIAQVLKRLPGITVSEAGKISYKGLPIKNFYIEGLNLMKGRYGIATNNVDPNNISTIQVLESHQDIKALKDLKPEERASINLKLKNGVRGVFNLITTLGGGYDDKALWNNELIGTYFKRNSQLLSTYKCNNSGNDLETELQSFSNSDYAKTSNISDIVMPSIPGIDKKYYYFNHSHSLTYNQMFRIGKDGELGINALYLNDKDERSNQSLTTNLLPDGTKNIVDERFNGIMHRDVANGNLNYMKNSKLTYINEQLKFDYLSTDGESKIFTGKDIAQSNSIENYRLHNSFHLVNRTGKYSGFEFLSKINIEKRLNNLYVSPNLFPDMLLADDMYQTAERRNFSTENNINLLSALVFGNLQINTNIFFNYSHNGLTSLLEDYNNNLNLTTLNTGLGVSFDYKIKKFNVYLYVTNNYRYSDLKNINTDVTTDKNRFVVEPRLTLKYSIDGRNEIKFASSLSHSNPAIENLFDQYILTSYRHLSVYENNKLYQSQVQYYSLSYNCKNIISMLFFGANLGWSHNRPDILYGSYYDGIVEKIISQPTEETSDVLSATLRVSKGLDWKRFKIGAECRYSYLDSPMLLQNSVIRYYGNIIKAKMDISFNPFDLLAFSYNGTYYQSQINMIDGGEMPMLRTLTNNTSFEFYLPYNISLGAGISHYYNNLNTAGNTSFLLGEVNMKYSYKKWFFTLTYDNVFNKKDYIYSTSSGLTESTSIYQIRPRSILLKIRYRIF